MEKLIQELEALVKTERIYLKDQSSNVARGFKCAFAKVDKILSLAKSRLNATERVAEVVLEPVQVRNGIISISDDFGDNDTTWRNPELKKYDGKKGQLIFRPDSHPGAGDKGRNYGT